MAWNEPGGNGKDPWGGGGDQGPPDLDEALKKLQQKFGGLMGGGSGNSPAASSGIVVSILVILAIVWAVAGVYQIDEQERGVILRFGKYQDKVSPGLHWNPRFIDNVYKVNVTQVRSHNVRAFRMLTEDQNIVEVNLSVQYTVSNPKDFLLEVRDPKISLAQATESSLRHVVGGSLMNSILTDGREEISIEVQSRLQDLMIQYKTGIEIAKVNIDDTRPPQAVQAAFDDVIKAKEDEERVKNEAEAYRNGVVPEARGHARRQLEESEAYKQQITAEAEGEAARFASLQEEYARAPEITRERLYLETMQVVMGSTNKVMVDSKGGNNMMYLPLDQLLKNAPVRQSNSGASDAQMHDLANRVADQVRSNPRRRETR